METIIGTIAGILTSISMLPQLIKVLKEKEVENISHGTIIVLICGVALWVVYGVLKNEWPIILSNGFSVLVNVTLHVYYHVYKKN
ncbi:SemiSWEET transporter [Paenimyroides aestuarii]|uniref:SemiSWEET transporter n=1 Tax=Paenimyroides aestuarii TaxID=2968490 RepID=A0ABY5NPC0_9FLAO|nr:SemiSWEET transporter [Paenimyroides aestuarii]UUV20393.1 SemiSWEET transporter [Paenimyroides aestuarii]